MAYEIKNIRGLYVSEFSLMFINFILSIILYSSNQFKNGLLRDLSKNWKMNPITNIKISSDVEQQNTIYLNKNFEFNWMNKTIKLEKMKSKFKYYNVLSNIDSNKYKCCGKDNDNNYLYFPRDEDCPINFIEITNNVSNISKKNYIKLSDEKYLHFHNNSKEGKILVELKISQHYPCPNIDYDNDFCPLFTSCDKSYKKCNLADYLLDKYTYEYLDDDLVDNFNFENKNIKKFSNLENINSTGLINKNDIIEKIDDNLIHYAFRDGKKIFILYKRSWIDYYNTNEEKNNTKEVKHKLKNFINMEKYARNKNRTLLAFSILIFLFIITKIIFINCLKDFDYFFFIFDFLIIIFLFIDIILISVSINRYKSFNSNFFKYSIFNYFKHNEKSLHKIEISLLFFNCIFFIIELFLFFFDFYQIEIFCNKYNINICLCCKSCMKIFNQFFDIKKIEQIKRTTTTANLITDENNLNEELNLNEPSRIQTEMLNQLKGKSKAELNAIIKNTIQNFRNGSLNVIREESENEQQINNSYDNVEEGTIDNRNIPNNIIIYNNSNQNEINFSQLNSDDLIFDSQPQNNTLHGNFGYIKKFRIKNSQDNKKYVLKVPILNKIEENSSKKLMKNNILKMNQINNEINLLKNFNHKNIVKCLGKRIDKDDVPCMVLENCEGGNLKTLLNNNIVTNEFKIKMIKQLAEALIYLHNKKYVHSDLKCDNILLDKPYNNHNSNYPNLKLSDFGCCVKFNEIYNNGNILYRAIEAIKDKHCIVTDKLDVYSYASTCYEIIKGKPPFDGNLSIFKLKIKEKNYQPNIDDLNCSNEMKNLLISCWNEIPEQRPTMKEVLNELKIIQIFEKNEI